MSGHVGVCNELTTAFGQVLDVDADPASERVMASRFWSPPSPAPAGARVIELARASNSPACSASPRS